MLIIIIIVIIYGIFIFVYFLNFNSSYLGVLRDGNPLQDYKFLNKSWIKNEIIYYFICSANVHVQMPSILCKYAPARTVWIKTRLQ